MVKQLNLYQPHSNILVLLYKGFDGIFFKDIRPFLEPTSGEGTVHFVYYHPFKKYVEYIFSPECLSMMSRSILIL